MFPRTFPVFYLASTPTAKKEEKSTSPTQPKEAVKKEEIEKKFEEIEIHPLVHLFKDNKLKKERYAYLEHYEAGLNVPLPLQEVFFR